jgi:Spy/CpxP family protein refolding chaperone
MRFLSLFLLGSVCLFWLQALAVFADPPRVNWWNDPQVIETLALTPEQRQKIDDLVQQSFKTRQELNSKLAPLQRQIPDLLSQSELDEQKLLNTVTTQAELLSARRRALITLRLSVRKALSVEQFQKLLELNPNIMRQRWIARQTRVKMKGGSEEPASPPPPAQEEKKEEKLP